jgi:creatinine amidohydrolase
MNSLVFSSKCPAVFAATPILAHSGDKHGAPERHRVSFPDGRVGSHSALAKPEHGVALTDAAVLEVKQDYLEFLKT